MQNTCTKWLKKFKKKKNTVKEIVIKTVQFHYKYISYHTHFFQASELLLQILHIESASKSNWQTVYRGTLIIVNKYTKLTEMTFPRADRDLLILAPSFSRSPVAPVLSALSDPAKSTKFITLLFLVSDPDSLLMIWSNVMVTTVWALLLVAFMLVEATVRLAVPMGELIQYKHNSKFLNF